MVPDTTALTSAGLGADGAAGSAIEGRAAIFEMTQAAEEAVLCPRDCGPWSHELRAALAARIATLHDERDLAGRYAVAAGAYATLADPSEDGSGQAGQGTGLTVVLAFMDKVAADTRNVAAEDIAALQAAGVADADIVRLCELNAFLAYQLRVVAGLRLMKGGYA